MTLVFMYIHAYFLKQYVDIFLILFFLGKPAWILWTDINQVIKFKSLSFVTYRMNAFWEWFYGTPAGYFSMEKSTNMYLHSSYQIHTPKLPVRTSLPGPSVQKNISNTIPNVKPSEQDQCIAWSLEYPHFEFSKNMDSNETKCTEGFHVQDTEDQMISRLSTKHNFYFIWRCKNLVQGQKGALL